MTQSPTEGDDTNSGGSNEPLPENQNPSADDTQQDSVSSDTQDTDQGNQGPDNQPTQDSQSSDDDGLNNFAKAQGFDPENLSDGEKKALKIAHDNHKAYRKNAESQSEELKNAVTDTEQVTDSELEDLEPAEAREARRDAEIATIKAENRVNNFYIRKPEAREYEEDMKRLVVEEAQKNGRDAARYLSSDLDRLLVLAKASRGDASEAAREEGRRAEREELRKRQEGSADAGHASNPHQAPQKVTRDWIANEYDPSNEEHRKMVDEAIARNDLY